jgi:Fur family ferric uptake transcriptional regulator
VFELEKGDHHDHIVCMETGEVIEFYDDVIETRQRQLVEDRGFDLVDHSLVLYVRPKKSK